jgi:hypothetical protein
MAGDSMDTRECPYCKEEIKAEATLCKHCGSQLSPQIPPHGGTCPFCKEDVHPEATKCKHCGSFIGSEQAPVHPSSQGGCGDCGGDSRRQMLARQQIGGGGYNPGCVRGCQIQCQWAGGPPFLCWYYCAWLCSGGRFPATGDIGLNVP